VAPSPDLSPAHPVALGHAPLIYNGIVAVTKDIAKRKLPVFDLSRCKQCGICSHFCPKGAIGVHDDGTPFLADPEACTYCGLCEDMCPDWAICLSGAHAGEPGERISGSPGASDNEHN